MVRVTFDEVAVLLEIYKKEKSFIGYLASEVHLVSIIEGVHE